MGKRNYSSPKLAARPENLSTSLRHSWLLKKPGVMIGMKKVLPVSALSICARQTSLQSSDVLSRNSSSEGDLDPAAAFFTAWAVGKIVYCVGDGVGLAKSRLGSVADVVDAGDPLDLELVLDDLYERGVRRLMVEGGGTMHTQFLTAGLADEIHAVIAPFFVGDPTAPRFVNEGVFPHGPNNRMVLAETRQIGDVVLLRYELGRDAGG
jgi:5-amino-6-(5-phosphoribosylamino)uracil reductase